MLDLREFTEKIKNDNEFRQSLIGIFFILLFVIITLPAAIGESPFHDSAFAWYLSKIITWGNYADILNIEGHCIIWYLILKPFSVNNFYYPYSLQIINWFFCFFAVLLIWKKAQFNNVIKVIITFSFLLTNVFSVVARCYAIGFLGLCLAAYYQKQSIKRPYLYSLLLGLTANTV